MDMLESVLNRLRDEIHANAVEHGWWNGDRAFPETVCMCHAELSEAVEEYRNGNKPYYELDGKPEGMAVEMIDCIIRILDWCGHAKVDVDEIIRKKMDYNKTRPYRHGNKRC